MFVVVMFIKKQVVFVVVCELLEFMSPDSDTPNSFIYRDYIKEGESVSKVNLSMESTQPF
jgi:hypothetical protein